METSDTAARLRFIHHLSSMTEDGRSNVLRIESDSELQVLWEMAFLDKWVDVAASIEVEANRRGQF